MKMVVLRSLVYRFVEMILRHSLAILDRMPAQNFTRSAFQWWYLFGPQGRGLLK